MQSSVPDIVRYLAAFSPITLQELQSKYPEAAVLRNSGLVMGESDSDPLKDVTIRMLDSLNVDVRKAILQTGRKMRIAATLELLAALLGAGSSTGLIGLLLTKQGDVNSRIALAVVSFVSSAIPLITKILRATTSGSAEITEIFSKLRSIVWEAAEIRAHLSVGSKDTDALLVRANLLAKDAFIALTDMGYKADFGPA